MIELITLEFGFMVYNLSWLEQMYSSLPTYKNNVAFEIKTEPKIGL